MQTIRSDINDSIQSLPTGYTQDVVLATELLGHGTEARVLLLASASNQQLRTILPQLFERRDQVPCGAAGLLLEEIRCGRSVEHLQKAPDCLARIEGILGGDLGPLTDRGRAIAGSLRLRLVFPIQRAPKVVP